MSEFRKRCLAVGFLPWRLVHGTAGAAAAQEQQEQQQHQRTTAPAAAAAAATQQQEQQEQQSSSRNNRPNDGVSLSGTHVFAAASRQPVVSADPGRGQGGARQGREVFWSQQQQQEEIVAKIIFFYEWVSKKMSGCWFLALEAGSWHSRSSSSAGTARAAAASADDSTSSGSCSCSCNTAAGTARTAI